MKAKSYLLAVSLVANLVFVWLLVRQPAAVIPEPALVQSAPTEEEMLPLPTASVPLSASALLPPPEPQWFGTEPEAAGSGTQARVLAPDEEKPYAPPLPPNPNAVPAWPERLPHRETQIHRSLLTEPKR